MVQIQYLLDDIDTPVHVVHHRTVVPRDRAVAQQDVRRLYPPDNVAPFPVDGQALRPLSAPHLLGHKQVRGSQRFTIVQFHQYHRNKQRGNLNFLSFS